MKNVTKGVVTASKKSNMDYVLGEYSRRIYNDNGEPCAITIGQTEEEAEANAILIADALNTHNATGYTPSELKRQKDELLEALEEMFEKSKDLFNHCIDQYWIDPEEDPTDGTMEMESALKKTGELLTKYSNNER